MNDNFETEGYEKPKQEGQTTSGSSNSSNNRSSYSFSGKPFFEQNLSLNFDKRLPNKAESFLQVDQIKKVRISSRYIELLVNQNCAANTKEYACQGNQCFFEEQFREDADMEFLSKQLHGKYRQFKFQGLQNKKQFSYSAYREWLKHAQHENTISWHMAAGQSGIELKAISISRKTLTIMGYTPDEAALELSTFKTGYMKYVSYNKVSVLSRQARTLIYCIYAQYFVKFVDAIYQGSINYDRLTSESSCVFENEIIGKNQRRIRAEVKISVVAPFIISMEMLSYSQGADQYDRQLDKEHFMQEEKYGQRISQQLNHIVDFPKPTRRDKNNRGSSFIMVENYQL